ncbi:hypothetical protein TURU_062608 [Turdus rufiventris]|nr:hypothetical protein TURU_062608 [Turdus rufiventris]
MDSISQVIHDCKTFTVIKQAKQVKPVWYGGRLTNYKYGKAWQIDYITLPQTHQSKHYVLTMVEATIGWLETYPVPHATARNTILGLEKQAYQSAFPDIPIGYSGHETGIAISVAAVAMGAKVLERHVTLDKTWKGSDHQASLEPNELAELVKAIRTVEKAMGSPVKQLLPCEMACNEKLGKSVVAKVAIPEGAILTLDMLTVKVGEPKGFPPESIFDLVGQKVKKNIEEDETITEQVVENHVKKVKC